MANYRDIATLLEKHDSWAIICHEKPDGDTLGCALALYALAVRLGKIAVVGGKDELPSKYAFLPNASAYKKLAAKDVPQDALLLCIDTSTRARSIKGIEELIAEHESVNIDHHGDNEIYCKHNLIDARASATAEIITRIICEKWEPQKDEATCLYTALVTDNGDFRFSSVLPDSHGIAEILMDCGAKQAEIDDCLNETMTIGSLCLWGKTLSETHLFADGLAAIVVVDDAMYRGYGATPADLENIVNQLLRIRGVKVALFVTESELKVKVSIRTRNPYNAREIAAYFGGGGHINAAGASMGCELPYAVAKVREKVEEYVRNLQAGLSRTE